MQVNENGVSSLLNQIQEKQTNLFEKLASGKKVNNASDGAAAQQIIDRLTSQVEGNRQAINNVYDGISLAQVAEGGLSNINDDVNRIRELTIQSGNGILTDGDRNAIQSEISQLQDNITQTILLASHYCLKMARLIFRSGLTAVNRWIFKRKILLHSLAIYCRLTLPRVRA